MLKKRQILVDEMRISFTFMYLISSDNPLKRIKDHVLYSKLDSREYIRKKCKTIGQKIISDDNIITSIVEGYTEWISGESNQSHHSSYSG